MEEGAEANLSDPFLRGALVELPEGGEALVAGDLHGNQKNYEQLLRIADLGRCADRRLILQELAHDHDPDRGLSDRSWQLVEMGARLKAAFPDRVHLIMGNHEFAEVCGLPILKSGCDMNERFARGVRSAYGERAGEVMAAYQAFWRTMPLAARTVHGVFICHSTPGLDRMGEVDLGWLRASATAERLDRSSPAFDLIWGRDYRPEAADEIARRVECDVLLVGHTSCRDGYRTPNHRHVILDSKDSRGVCVLIPLTGGLSQAEVVGRIRRIREGVGAFEWS